LNILLCLSVLGLIVIAGYIFYFRKKYNTGALLSERPKPGFDSSNLANNNINEVEKSEEASV
jgi:hypothetical protein